MEKSSHKKVSQIIICKFSGICKDCLRQLIFNSILLKTNTRVLFYVQFSPLARSANRFEEKIYSSKFWQKTVFMLLLYMSRF